MNDKQHIISIGDIKMNIPAMIVGACFGGMITLACICRNMNQRIEKLEKDIEKLIENN